MTTRRREPDPLWFFISSCSYSIQVKAIAGHFVKYFLSCPDLNEEIDTTIMCVD